MLSKKQTNVKLLVLSLLVLVILTGCNNTTSKNIEVESDTEIETKQDKKVELIEAEIELSNRGGFISRNQKTNEERVSLDNTTDLGGNLDLPPHFRYQKIDYNILRDFLKSRNSEIAKGDRLESVERVAKEYGISPLLYIAIVGAEQSLVPVSPSSHKIIKNPFNLYGSWENYGVSFENSLEGVSRTILNLMGGYRYSNKDPYVYLNIYYAEDKNWHNNVRSYHQRLIKQQNN